MTIAAILTDKGGDVSTIAASATVREAVELLAARRIGALPVIANGAIAGIFSERDLVGCVARNGADALEMLVEQAMSAPAVTVDPSTPILAALATMTQRRIRHLPVIESSEIRGIVSIGDLVKHRIERIEAEAEALRDYIQRA